MRHAIPARGARVRAYLGQVVAEECRRYGVSAPRLGVAMGWSARRTRLVLAGEAPLELHELFDLARVFRALNVDMLITRAEAEYTAALKES